MFAVNAGEGCILPSSWYTIHSSDCSPINYSFPVSDATVSNGTNYTFCCIRMHSAYIHIHSICVYSSRLPRRDCFDGLLLHIPWALGIYFVFRLNLVEIENCFFSCILPPCIDYTISICILRLDLTQYIQKRTECRGSKMISFLVISKSRFHCIDLQARRILGTTAQRKNGKTNKRIREHNEDERKWYKKRKNEVKWSGEMR